MQESDETLYGRFMAEKNENDLRILLERHRESLILFLNGYVRNLKDAEELMLDAYAGCLCWMLMRRPLRRGLPLEGRVRLRLGCSRSERSWH